MGAYLTWVDQQRLLGAAQSAFLVWFENHSEALAIGPAMPHGAAFNSPLDLKWLMASSRSLEPGNAKALDNLGVLYVLTGQTSRAVETFSDCISRAPKFDQAYLNLARVEMKLGKPQQAARVLRQLL